jgi:hypothetical protein
MTTHRDYPPVTCNRHHTFLVDVIGDDGTIVQHCRECVELTGDKLESCDVVRALYRSAMRGAVR